MLGIPETSSSGDVLSKSLPSEDRFLVPRNKTGPTLVWRRKVKWLEDSAVQVLPAKAWSICIVSSSLFPSNETPRSLNFLRSFWGMVHVKAPESKEQGNQRHSSTKARSSSADLNITAQIFRDFPLIAKSCDSHLQKCLCRHECCRLSSYIPKKLDLQNFQTFHLKF